MTLLRILTFLTILLVLILLLNIVYLQRVSGTLNSRIDDLELQNSVL